MPVLKIPNAADLNNENCSCDPDCCGGSGEGKTAEGMRSYARWRALHDRAGGNAGRRNPRRRFAPRPPRPAGERCASGWAIGRSRYAVAPGLYALGAPDPWSPVFVTANYKLSFDRLRTAAPGLNAWILVLDTRGINVWCAAGKGTFGTDEVVRRIEATGPEKNRFPSDADSSPARRSRGLRPGGRQEDGIPRPLRPGPGGRSQGISRTPG